LIQEYGYDKEPLVALRGPSGRHIDEYGITINARWWDREAAIVYTRTRERNDFLGPAFQSKMQDITLVPKRLVVEALASDLDVWPKGVRSLSKLDDALAQARNVLDHQGWHVSDSPAEILSTSSWWILVYDVQGEGDKQIAAGVNRFNGHVWLANARSFEERYGEREESVWLRIVGRMEVPVTAPAVESSTSEIVAQRLPAQYYEMGEIRTNEQTRIYWDGVPGYKAAAGRDWTVTYYLRDGEDLSDEELAASREAFREKGQFLPEPYAEWIEERLGELVPEGELSKLDYPCDPPEDVVFHINATTGEITIESGF
jgi:hypothetical protein